MASNENHADTNFTRNVIPFHNYTIVLFWFQSNPIFNLTKKTSFINCPYP